MAKKQNKKPTRDDVAREKIRSKVIVIYGAPIQFSTGNSKLILAMATVLKQAGHTVYTIGLDYNGPQMWYKNIPVFPSFFCEHCGNAKKGSAENVQKIADTINLLNMQSPKGHIDYFICVGDSYQMQQMGIGKLQMKETKKMMYLTIDSEGTFCNKNEEEKGHPEYLEQCDRIISTSNFTKEQLKYWVGMDSDLIHEPIDLNIYKPVDDSKKQELRQKHGFEKKDFIIFNSGRLVMRKRMFTLLDGCAKFLCDHDNAYLMLNCPSFGGKYPDTLNPIDFVTRVLKKKYGRDLIKEGKIIFIERGGLGDTGISEKDNAEYYQISDVYATTTGGEGFGLCSVEANSCGIPSIIPHNSTAEENIGIKKREGSKDKPFDLAEGGIILDAPHAPYLDWGLRQRWTNPEILYDGLKYLYDNPDIRKHMGKSGREYAEKMFNIQLFGQKWKKVIETTKKKKEEKEPNKDFNKIELGEEDKQSK